MYMVRKKPSKHNWKSNMKTPKLIYGIFLFALLSSMLLIPRTTTASEIYEIDPDHSAITFKVKHMGITFVYGRFNNMKGTYTFNDNVPENCFIDIRVKAADIDTGNVKRDNHLRSPDFFDADNFPDIAFKSVFVKKLQESTYEVVGYMTLHGVSQSVTVQAVKTGDIQIPGGEVRTGFETTFTIRRSDYGMKYMLGGVGDKVELTVSVEGVRNE
jgi:polyisoprenoid-binding protein YceI